MSATFNVIPSIKYPNIYVRDYFSFYSILFRGFYFSAKTIEELDEKITEVIDSGLEGDILWVT